MKEKEIRVYAHWKGMENPFLMGLLRTTRVRGKEIFSFEYDNDWLQSPVLQIIDPDLQHYNGPQYLRDDKNNFGIFLDSSPDRWGRLLMRRREAAYARIEDRKEEPLFESDYLLGVFDGHRMGALRFKTSENGPFLNYDQAFATPPWTTLRELEFASLQLEREDIMDDPDYFKWLSLLMAPGSSLGGARPKASVLDPQGLLWIAKFPSKNDQRNVGAWEMVIQELAFKAGINVAETRLQKFSSNFHTFLSRRFDRTFDGERVHFASAMTMLGHKDGMDYRDGASYLEIVEFLMKYGATVDQDLEELWRRIVFNICVSNTDDHLRNHGFLLTSEGWILSPAYDVNPEPMGTGLSLNISENDNSLNLDLALDVAPFFRLNMQRAKQIIEVIQASVQNWQKVAKKYSIPRNEQELMAPAFKKFSLN